MSRSNLNGKTVHLCHDHCTVLQWLAICYTLYNLIMRIGFVMGYYVLIQGRGQSTDGPTDHGRIKGDQYDHKSHQSSSFWLS